jgi:hypothetical protein
MININLQSQREANQAVRLNTPSGRTDGVTLTSALEVLVLPDESLLAM